MPIQLEPYIVHELAPALKRSLSADGRLVIFTLTDYSTDTLDCWAASVRADVLGWSPNQIMLVVQEMVAYPSPATPFEIRRRFESMWAGPIFDRLIYVAYVAPSPLFLGALRVIMQVSYRNIPGEFMKGMDAFGSRAEAIAWLASQIDRA